MQPAATQNFSRKLRAAARNIARTSATLGRSRVLSGHFGAAGLRPGATLGVRAAAIALHENTRGSAATGPLKCEPRDLTIRQSGGLVALIRCPWNEVSDRPGSGRLQVE